MTKVDWVVCYYLTNWGITIIELSSKFGNATAICGKWHICDVLGSFVSEFQDKLTQFLLLQVTSLFFLF